MTCPAARSGSAGSGAIAYAEDDYVVVGTGSVPDDEHNAFPGLTKVAPSCRLLVAYRKAVSHVSVDGRIVTKTSDDVGHTWSAETVIYDPVTDARDPDLVTLSGGKVLCNFFLHNGTTPTGLGLLTSTDNGATWTTNLAMGNGAFTGWAACSGKILELSNGELLWPIYGRNTADTFDTAAVLRSTDGGATWGSQVTVANGPTASRHFNEMALVRSQGGGLIAFIRTDTSPYSLYRSTSGDNGATWSAPAAVYDDFGPGRPAPVVMSSGAIILGYRQTSTLDAWFATSWDDGLTWTRSPAAYSFVTQAYASGVELVAGWATFVIALENVHSPDGDSDIWCQSFADGAARSEWAIGRVRT